jgi:hypothetical protein
VISTRTAGRARLSARRRIFVEPNDRVTAAQPRRTAGSTGLGPVASARRDRSTRAEGNPHTPRGGLQPCSSPPCHCRLRARERVGGAVPSRCCGVPASAQADTVRAADRSRAQLPFSVGLTPPAYSPARLYPIRAAVGLTRISLGPQKRRLALPSRSWPSSTGVYLSAITLAGGRQGCASPQL